jgi:glutamate/tyrosine decarboxylase-like PLP-dependent enzyme
MVADDIELSKALFAIVQKHSELEACTRGLSITTFRYVPRGLKPGPQGAEEYLNKLNHKLLTRLQRSGETFLTNAVIRGKFVLRACFVNFRSTLADVEALPGIVTRIGAEVDAELRPKELKIDD